MTKYEVNGQTLIHGDSREVLKRAKDNSIDVLISDLPYNIGFMRPSGEAGKDYWDSTGISFDVAFWREVYRVLKPGAHAFVFGGTRTFHRIAVAMEDAGFELRDTLFYMFGSAMPKGINVSKALVKRLGAQRELTREGVVRRDGYGEDWDTGSSSTRPRYDKPATELAAQWEGWNSALKTAYEPILMMRKPFKGALVDTLMEWGTGALNVDACRIEGEPVTINTFDDGAKPFGGGAGHDYTSRQSTKGRWPTNIIMDDFAAVALDAQVGNRKAGGSVAKSVPSRTGESGIYGDYDRTSWESYSDDGGPSRFFSHIDSGMYYTSKASRKERDHGLDDLPEYEPGSFAQDEWSRQNMGGSPDATRKPIRNTHKTVKPLDLMRWLVRLGTPPNGVVLDPFLGSGTTAMACYLEGFRCVGIEQSEEYIEIAKRRVEHAEGLRTKSMPKAA